MKGQNSARGRNYDKNNFGLHYYKRRDLQYMIFLSTQIQPDFLMYEWRSIQNNLHAQIKSINRLNLINHKKNFFCSSSNSSLQNFFRSQNYDKGEVVKFCITLLHKPTHSFQMSIFVFTINALITDKKITNSLHYLLPYLIFI